MKKTIIIKNKLAIERMKIAGKLLAEIMLKVKKIIVPGITTFQIDNFIEKKMISVGLKPECKGYAGYKHATCISLNDEIVHGVPSDKIILKSGDFVKIDVVGSYKNYCVDITRCFFVEQVDEQIKKIALVAQEALDKAINLAVVGNSFFDLSSCIQEFVEKEGFGVVRDFSGHGIGKQIHEEPNIPNYVQQGREKGPILRVGMTFALEPMITQGSYAVKIMQNGWTAKTADGGLAAHVEDTILVTENGPEIFTRI